MRIKRILVYIWDIISFLGEGVAGDFLITDNVKFNLITRADLWQYVNNLLFIRFLKII